MVVAPASKGQTTAACASPKTYQYSLNSSTVVPGLRLIRTVRRTVIVEEVRGYVGRVSVLRVQCRAGPLLILLRAPTINVLSPRARVEPQLVGARGAETRSFIHIEQVGLHNASDRLWTGRSSRITLADMSVEPRSASYNGRAYRPNAQRLCPSSGVDVCRYSSPGICDGRAEDLVAPSDALASVGGPPHTRDNARVEYLRGCLLSHVTGVAVNKHF